MLKKEIAGSFLKLVASGNAVEAFSRFVDHDFIHHNQYSKGDQQSLQTAMIEAHAMSLNKSIEIKQIFQDSDTVITHSQVLRQASELPPLAVVHIFRFRENKIVELWDLGQEIMKESPNQNGAF